MKQTKATEFFHTNAPFPYHVGKYTYASAVNVLPSRNKTYLFALYKDASGHKALAKVWFGLQKDNAYRELKKEAMVLKALQNVPAYSGYGVTLRTLAYIGHQESTGTFLLLTKLEKGKTLSTLPESIYTGSVFIAADVYLKELQSRLDPWVLSLLPKRTIRTMMLLYPVVFLRACTVHPDLFKPLLVSAFVAFRQFFKVFLYTKTSISHKDLHAKNILVQGKSYILTDFQHIALAPRPYDLVTALLGSWHHKTVRTDIQKQLSMYPGEVVRFLTIYIATLYVTGNNFSRRKYINYRETLKWISHIHNAELSVCLSSMAYKLVCICIDTCVSFFYPKEKNVTLPKRIGLYAFVRNLRSKKSYPFAIGLYRNSQGTPVVAKKWQGKRKDIHYFELSRELLVLSVFERMRRRIGTKLPSEFNLINTPHVTAVVRTRDSFIILTSFVKGRKLLEYPSVRTQFETYLRAKSYIQFLGGYASNDEKAAIGEKKIPQFMFQFPMILAASIFQRPKLGIDSIRGALYWIMSTSFSKGKNTTLVHGDLHPENIIVSNKQTTIVDVEQTLFTYPEYEVISGLSSVIAPLGFLQMLSKHYIESDIYSRKMLGLCAVECSIHNLTSPLSSRHINRYHSMLLQGIDWLRGSAGSQRFIGKGAYV
jgi:thiamine kinase-like enzyme